MVSRLLTQLKIYQAVPDATSIQTGRQAASMAETAESDGTMHQLRCPILSQPCNAHSVLHALSGGREPCRLRVQTEGR